MVTKIHLKKIILKIVLPMVLFFLWIALTSIQIIFNDESLTVITKRYQINDIKNVSFDKILAEQKRAFEFKATQNNLGAVKIHFETFDGNNNDTLIVSIREKGSNKEYYSLKENTQAFTSLPFYPFGFPLIPNSKDKTYIVEVKSETGSPTTSVAIKKNKHVFAALYQFDKQKILSNWTYAVKYLINKGLNSLENNYFIFTTSVYLYPFIIYAIWLFLERKLEKSIIFQKFNLKSKYNFYKFVIFLLGLVIAIDIFLVGDSFDLVFLLISVIWGFLLFKYKKESADSYKAALALLILCPILQLLGQDAMVEKAAAWAFLALTVGVIINMYELRKSKTQSTY